MFVVIQELRSFLQIYFFLSSLKVYVDASPDCNTLTVLRGDSDIVGATTAAAEWLVKVSQIRT